jgi:hypothetical protein
MCQAAGVQNAPGAPLAAKIDSEGPSLDTEHRAENVLVDSPEDKIGTIWLSPNDENSWFIINLGGVQKVYGVNVRNTLHDRYRDRWTTQVSISTSKDKMQWEDAMQNIHLPKSTKLQSFTFGTPGLAQYIKVVMKGFGGVGGGMAFFQALGVVKEGPHFFSDKPDLHTTM